MKKQINIFIVSPTDVNDERAIAHEVCLELNEAIGMDIEVNPILWEYHPMSYHKNAQANIDDVLDTCDVFVVILWHRMGSVVEGYEGAITKSKNVTGTQYEIEKIVASKKESVFFYFKTGEKHFTSTELKEASKQRHLLDTFLKDINLTKGSTYHGYHEFKKSDEFRQKLMSHLAIEIEKRTQKKIYLPSNTRVTYKSINISHLLVILLSIVAFVVILLLGDSKEKKNVFQEEKLTQKTVHPPIDNKDTFSVYMEMQGTVDNSISKKTYMYFLEALTSADIEVSTDDSKKDFKVELTQNTKQTTYILSDIEMIKMECTLSYIVVDSHKNSTIKAESKRGEATHFNSDNARTECLYNMYEDMSKTLIKTLTRIKNDKN